MQGHAAATQAFGCAQCGGTWLGGAASARLRDNLGPDVIAFAAQVELQAPQRVDTRGAMGGCPFCNSALLRHFDAEAGIELDSCMSHGTWFDRGEIQRVAEAVARRAVPQYPLAPQAPYEQPVPADYVPPAARMSPGAKVGFLILGGIGFLLSLALTIAYVLSPFWR